MSGNGTVREPAAINYLPMARAAEVAAALRAAGFLVAIVDGERVTDAASLFAAVSAQLLEGDVVANWGSLADRLLNFASDQETDQVALVWTHVDRMLDGGLRDLMAAADVLLGTTRRRYAEGGVFVSYLAGTGPNFADR